MRPDEYVRHDGLGLAQLVESGEVDPAELLDAAIERIEALDPGLNAVVHRGDVAARRALESLPRGPFRGVPFLVKDLGCPVAGMPMTDGSRYLRDHVPSADGPLTRAYREAGLVILGKTNTPELGISGTAESARLGPCRNPWNRARTAGGSSGGAAAAVASGMVPLAHGSDGAGSIRLPAACSGLFGLKLSRARHVPAIERGEQSFHAFASHHVLTRSVRDSAAMLDVTRNAADPYAPAAPSEGFLEASAQVPGRLRIAYSADRPSGERPEPFVVDALGRTARLLDSLGHTVEEVPLPLAYQPFYDAFATVGAAGFAVSIDALTAELGREPVEDELEPVTWQRLERGRRHTGAEVAAALETIGAAARSLAPFFERYDVFLCPTLATAPPEIGHLDPVTVPPAEHSRRSGYVFFLTLPFNATGQPAMSVPLERDAAGLPIGMHFAAGFGDEATLLRLARQLETAQPWTLPASGRQESGRRPA